MNLVTRGTAIAATLLLALAAAGPSASEPEALDLHDVGAGELLSRSEHGFARLPVTKLEVDLSVTGIMLRGAVTEEFRNPAAEVIDAVYVFPLPERAAVDAMEMRIGDRRIVAVVKDQLG